MYFVMLSTSFSLAPVDGGYKRIVGAIVLLAIGAGWGWPFVGVLGIPVVVEQLWLRGDEKAVKGGEVQWGLKRMKALAIAIIIGLLLLVRSFLSHSLSSY